MRSATGRPPVDAVAATGNGGGERDALDLGALGGDAPGGR